LFFNFGVEVGQVLFIVAVLPLFHLLKKSLAGRFDLPRLEPLSVNEIGSIASYWVFEQVLGFRG